MKIPHLALFLSLAVTVSFSSEFNFQAIRGGLSPDRKYEVLLCDDTSTLYVKDLASGFLIGGTEYFIVDLGFTGIIHRDLIEERTPHESDFSVNWSPKSDAVAIQRKIPEWPSSASILLLNDRGVFVDAIFPGYFELTGYVEPKLTVSRLQWFSAPDASQFVEWTEKGTLIFDIDIRYFTEFEGEDPLKHRVEVEIERMWQKLVIARDGEQAEPLKP